MENITYYPDTDGDGYGDADGTTVSLSTCLPIPDGYVENADDCDDTNANRNPGIGDIYVYTDKDGDGYGNDDLFVIQDSCIDLIENQSFESGDCDDNDASIHPGATEVSDTDGIDQDCDGTVEPIVWEGANITIDQPANLKLGEDNYDAITGNVGLTRSPNGYITNVEWWVDNFSGLPDDTFDLPWEYFGRKAQNPPTIEVGVTQPSGGPGGIRWAILEKGKDNDAWNNFDMYGTLGDPTNYLSLNNIITICQFLDINQGVVSIVDDFGVNFEPGEEPLSEEDASTESFPILVGKVLGVWLVEENIYFTLTFDKLDPLGQGGSMTYTRSTPNQ